MNQEVEGESSLRWYRTVNEEFEAERYIDSSLGQEAVRCRFSEPVNQCTGAQSEPVNQCTSEAVNQWTK